MTGPTEVPEDRKIAPHVGGSAAFRAFIRDEQVLADPLGDMVKRIKAGFILLQTGMGLGVAQGSAGTAEIELSMAGCGPVPL